MKKENKKLAQERRAAEKKRNAIRNVVSNISKVGIPVVLLLIFIGVMIANPFSKKSTGTTLQTKSSLEVKDGDTVNIDYVGRIDGVAFEGGDTKGQGAQLTIGSGTYIDNFEEQLIGSHPGDEVKVTVTFPENYGNEELNGKEAVFDVVVNGIYK
jgi:trigger factor